MREHDFFFRADPKDLPLRGRVAFFMTLPSAGLLQSQCNYRRSDAKFLTVAPVVRGARASCGGFRRAGAATFHVFLRLQVTKFSFLESTPNGLNYMDILRLSLHGRCRLPDKDITRKRLVLL